MVCFHNHVARARNLRSFESFGVWDIVLPLYLDQLSPLAQVEVVQLFNMIAVDFHVSQSDNRHVRTMVCKLLVYFSS